jgi:hypothetical protein
MRLQQGLAMAEMGTGIILRGNNSADRMSLLGQSQLGGASCRSSQVRNAPFATVGPKKAACREGPKGDVRVTWSLT